MTEASIFGITLTITSSTNCSTFGTNSSRSWHTSRLLTAGGGELNGRPRPPYIPPPGATPISVMPGFIRVDQTTEVVDPLSVTMEEAEIIAKTEEEAVVIEDIGIIRDVDLANTIYTIPEVSEEHTPTMEFDSVKSDAGADSDVSIEP